MKFLRIIPLLALPMIAYAALWSASPSSMGERLAEPLFSLRMASADIAIFSLGSVLTIIAALCLFVEIVRSALPTKAALAENMASALLLVACIFLFLLVPGFGTAEFFIIALLLLLDFLTDSTIMVLTSRRTIEYERR